MKLKKKPVCQNCCEHKELKYCNNCDVVFCEVCKREWGEQTPQDIAKGIGTYTYFNEITQKYICSHHP